MFLNQNKNIYRVFVKLTVELQIVIINTISTGWKAETVFS